MAAQMYDEEQMDSEHRVVAVEGIEAVHAGEDLDGLPFDCWWIGFLKLILKHHGVDVPYPYLLGLSGEAFSIHYESGNPERAQRIWTYEGGDDTDFLNRACRAFGFAFTVHRPDGFEHALAEVRAQIDDDQPVLISCGHGPALVVGYHVPEGIYAWIHPERLYAKVDDHGWVIPETLEEHWSKARLPFGEPSPFLSLTFRQVAEPRDEAEAVREALRAAVTQAGDVTSARFPDLRRGDAAWAAWIDDLQAGRAREPFLYGRFLSTLVCRRLAAAALCCRAAEILPDSADALTAAAGTYDALAAGLHSPAEAGPDAPTAVETLRQAAANDRAAVAGLP